LTTSNSPASFIKSQADRIAALLKAAERGENVGHDPAGKVAAARLRETVKFGIVMDDKIVTVEMPWSIIRDTDVTGISLWIVSHMSGKKAVVQ
jgi:hypothetical protein